MRDPQRQILFLNSQFHIILYVTTLKTMNRSITKTRGELERITYKINQLKNKYITDGQPYSKNDKSYPITPEKEQHYGRTPMASHSNLYNEVRPREADLTNREFKLFRNEIYQYIDKCLTVNRQKEMIQGQKAEKNKGGFDFQERFKLIEEELTACVASNQDLLVELKKHEKKTQGQIQKLEDKIKNGSGQASKDSPKLQELREKFQIFQTSLQQRLLKLEQNSTAGSDIKQLENIVGQIEQQMVKLSKQVRENSQKANKQMTNKIQQVEDYLKSSLQSINQDIEQVKEEVKENKLREVQFSEQMKHISEQLAHFGDSLQERGEQSSVQDKNQIEQMIKDMFQSLQQNLKCEIEEITSKMQDKIASISNAPDFQAQLETLTQQIEKLTNADPVITKCDHEQLTNNLQQFTAQQISKSQQEWDQMLCEKVQLMVAAVEEGKNKEKQQLKCMRTQIKEIGIFYEKQMENMKEELTKRICLIEEHKAQVIVDSSSYVKTEGSKHIPSEEKEQDKPNNIQEEDLSLMVEQKLNQFESDINDTLKMLYDDFDTKVKQVFAILNIDAFKEELALVQAQLKSLKQAEGQITVDGKISENTENLQELKNQLYNYMGESVEKLSMILEKTVEESEIKMEKLDQNFHYVYEKLSNIQFDNASFKDQLSSFMARDHNLIVQSSKKLPESSQKLPESSQKLPASDQKSSNSLLDVLGTFSSGNLFLGDD